MRQAILTIAFTAQLALAQNNFPILQEHFGLGSAQTYYVLVVDASGDKKMKAAWEDIKTAIATVGSSIDPQSNLSVIIFDEYASVVYTGAASVLNLDSFPGKPTGLYTDWGRALEKVYEVCKTQKGIGIVFTLSVCCVSGVDTRSDDSPYQDTASPAWIALRDEFQQSGRDIYFVPVIVQGGASSYTDLIRFTVGKDKVLPANITLLALQQTVATVIRTVISEAITGIVREELEQGNIQVKYEIKGDEKERLFIINNYRFLPVEVRKIDSIGGDFLRIDITNENRKYLDGLKIPPRDTMKVEKSDLKGIKKERWDYSLRTSGLWFYFHELDSVGVYGTLAFDCEKEINELGLSTQVKTAKNSVEIKKINWATIGGSFALIVAFILWIAYSAGKRNARKIKK